MSVIDDIDKPYISGSLYNLTNPSLAHLPIQDHITTLSSKTIGAQEYSYNQLCFSNLKDNEEISLTAQKDYTQSINNNFSQTIHNNKDSKVKGSYTESITKYHKQEVLGLKDVRVGGEYLTNVALSKDTIVGLSHTLNIGASNTLRVAKDSSESIGGDKEVEIGNNLSSSAGGDLHTTIKGNSETIIEGDKQEYIGGNLDITSQSQGNISTQKGLYTHSQTLSFQAKDIINMESDSMSIDTQSDCSIQANNTINLNIGETTITATSDTITLKAGGVEVVIDSNGLVVKGGEIKSE
ncbi:bacteriophage T4 gp5 trimerisation domain-containing protein, partial [Helicobacter bilis]|uniref:VgrG protein n=1 Tax=Helicobacter bilis TaxID=37372 RepID=A0A4V6I5T3_9HELI